VARPIHILGLSAFYHDSAACLLRDGRIVAAAQEERFSRRKHDDRFPSQAVAYCLREGAVEPAQLDLVVFYDKPVLKFERLLETYLAFAPAGFRAFAKAMPLWLGGKLHVPRQIDRGLGGAYRGRYVFVEHHESHAASAFFPSPFEEAAILTMDGVGEWATASFGVGSGNRIALTHEMRFPHSLGLLYSAFTYFCGFRVNSGEYKLMGLAPYGRPVYREKILSELIDLKADGSFWMDQRFFDYCAGLRMTSGRFDALFGGPPRRPESPLTQREMDLAASVQAVTTEIVLRMARHVVACTGRRKLVLAGGVALNCVANGRLVADGIVDDLWIQPAAGDAGGALGAAMFAWHQLLGHPRAADGAADRQEGSLLGPGFDADQVQAALDAAGARYRRHEREEELLEQVAALLAAEKVVGFFQGRMEFGPRALGARSILGDARSHRMQSVLNRKIKFRESFRPFAPSVLAEHAAGWFDLPKGLLSPYMLLVADVTQSRRLPVQETEGLDRLKAVRSTIPAVTHVDFSARLQTVDRRQNPRFRRLLELFHARTGCPVLINTSFNIRGEPIVCTPGDAWRCFMATDMDAVVIENFLLLKSEQPPAEAGASRAYLAARELD